jgi:EpsI family protein
MNRRTSFWLVSSLFLATSGVLYGRGNTDRQVPSEPLDRFPSVVSGRTGQDRSLDPKVLEVLGDGRFLSRLYTSSDKQPPVDLFLAYFPSQRTGSTIHSPKNCLPGSGWYFESSLQKTITAVDGHPYRVGEYVISNGNFKQLVIYWYQAHGRSVASEYWAKIYLVEDAIRTSRTDGALVRVITPVTGNEEIASARTRAEHFAAQIAPELHRFIPD